MFRLPVAVHPPNSPPTHTHTLTALIMHGHGAWGRDHAEGALKKIEQAGFRKKEKIKRAEDALTREVAEREEQRRHLKTK